MIQFMRGDGILSSDTVPAAGQPIYDSGSNMLAIGDGITDASNLYGVNAMRRGPIRSGVRLTTNYWPTSAREGVDLVNSWIIPNAWHGTNDLLLMYGYFYLIDHIPVGYDYPYGPHIVMFDYEVSVPPEEDFPSGRDLSAAAYLQATVGINTYQMSNSTALKCIPYLKVGIYSAELSSDRTTLTLRCYYNTEGWTDGDISVFSSSTFLFNWFCIYELL